MKNIIIGIFLLLSFGCSGRDPINNNDGITVSSATEAKIQTLIKAEAQARQERDAAIKTSQDAKQQHLRNVRSVMPLWNWLEDMIQKQKDWIRLPRN
jgi:hypothetical protein